MGPEGIEHEASFTFERHDPESLFRALLDPDALRTWFAEHVDVEPRAGGRFAFWGRSVPWVAHERDATQRVTRLEPARALGFVWDWRGVPGEVLLTLTPKDGATVVHVRHGVARPLLRDEQETRWAIGDFWRLSMGNLSEFLRRGRAALLPDFSETGAAVELSIEVDAPPARVFDALSRAEELDLWIATRGQVELRQGGAYSYGWTVLRDGRPASCGPTTVLAVDRDSVLVTDWVHGEEPPSRVEWRLSPLDGGTRTRVTLTHRRHDGAEPARSGYVQGWSAFLVLLAAHASGRSGAR